MFFKATALVVVFVVAATTLVSMCAAQGTGVNYLGPAVPGPVRRYVNINPIRAFTSPSIANYKGQVTGHSRTPGKGFTAYPDVIGVAPLELPESAEAETKARQVLASEAAKTKAHESGIESYQVAVNRFLVEFPVDEARCMNPDYSPWRKHTPARAATGAFLSVKAYDIGSQPGLHIGDTFTLDTRAYKVLFVDRNGRQSKHLGDYTGPFFVVEESKRGDPATPEALWVVFRGSKTVTDWIKDLTATWAKVSLARQNGQKVLLGNVHLGFAEIWEQYHFSTTLRRLFAGARAKLPVRFAGHSLGGALAQLAALEHHVRVGGQQPEVYTIGSPRVGGVDFREWLHGHIVHFRFKNENDVVPSVPTYGLLCMASFATGSALYNPLCRLHYYHAADVSVRLLHKNEADPNDPREVVPLCIHQDNARAGYDPLDHSSLKYARKLFDLAILESKREAAVHDQFIFNLGLNPYDKH